MVFADKLQSLRKSKGLSQEELAEKCNVTRQSVSKWETGLGYPETEKLLILCEILDVDLDYLMRDKTATAEDCSVQREISSYESYVGKWVRIFLKDREFNGLHCVALVSIQKSYLIIMNDKGKLGFIDGYSVSTISDFVDKKKQMKLPPIPSKESIKDIGNYLVGKRCDVRLKQNNLLLGLGFNKPGGFYSVTIENISNVEVIACDLNKCKYTSRLSDVLYIKEC